MLTGVVFFACCAPALAAPLAHPGRAIVAAPAPAKQSLQRLQAYPRTLIELDRVRGPAATPILQRAGGELIAQPLALWRLPSWTAQRVLPGLLGRGLVRSVTPDVPVGTKPGQAAGFFSQFTDPLSTSQWWVSHVGADRWTPPGPGVPLAMIDSGVDLSHEEFASRPNTFPLNAMSFSGNDEELHGTATASVAAAPENGVGIVGIYPQAKLQLWDASPNSQLTVSDEINGLFAARRTGPGVVNLSLGGFDRIPIEEHAIMNVFSSGSLIVASAGNDREGGSSLSFPASFPHVLTVGATDENDRVAVFSSASPALDLTAPGQDIQAAIPTIFSATGYSSMDGTSFSAPLVSGAAAAVWTLRPTLTNTQLFQVMRRSARDVGKRGWDADTGYGILNLPAALSRSAPADDPQEPNEDVYLVKPNGLTKTGHAPLTRQSRPRASLAAQLERQEDPEDLYRVWLPARGRLVVTVRPTVNANLEIWGRRTRTVFERGRAAKRDLIASSAHAGRRFERVTLTGRGVGQYVYVDVFLAKNVVQGSYTLNISPSSG
jgi:subtilase family protein